MKNHPRQERLTSSSRTVPGDTDFVWLEEESEMFGPGDFVEVSQRAQKVNKSITTCTSRKYHEIYFYFVKLFVNLLSF